MSISAIDLEIFRLSPLVMANGTLNFVERGTKTRTGATERENSRAFRPKMWETPDNPERCPVRLFLKYRDECPQSMLLPESPFFLSINWNHKPGGKWYKSQPVGINIIRKFMSRIATKAELSGRKTNHSARKTTVEKLCRSNIPDRTVMQVTGHKNVQSLNAYKKPSLENNRKSYLILSAIIKPQLINKHCHTFYKYSITLSNSTFNSCTITFNIQCDHEIEPKKPKLDSIEL